MTKTISRVILPLALLIPLLGLAACQQTPKTKVDVTGLPVRPDLAIDVEVTNWNGTVTVIANPRYKQPQVLSRVRRLSKDAPRATEIREAVKVEANTAIEAGRRVLRVKGEPTGTATDKQAASDLIVRVARAEDVRISNVGGEVYVVGWSGGLNVVNGPGGRPGGNIQVRTQAGITSDVNLVTSGGKIIYKSGPGTTGQFDLSGGPGDRTAEFEARFGRVTDSKPDPFGRTYRGVVNAGANTVVLRSDKGLVRAELIENAGTAGPDEWDGWPNTATGPKFVRILAGDEEWAPGRRTPKAQ